MEIGVACSRVLQKAKIMRIAQNITQAVSADTYEQTLARPRQPKLPPPIKIPFLTVCL